jgi:alpha,alpha-trehalase
VSTNSIGDYALLSDRHSAALTSRDGSVDWLCFPHFDSPSVFARLLGAQAGHWSLRAAGATSTTRRYLERTMVLETTYTTPAGTAVVVDVLAVGEGNRGHELGRGAPHLFLRRVMCSRGEVALEMEYSPRPDYGVTVPSLAPVGGGVVATSEAETLILSATVPLSVDGSSASAHFHLREGQDAEFSLQ